MGVAELAGTNVTVLYTNAATKRVLAEDVRASDKIDHEQLVRVYGQRYIEECIRMYRVFFLCSLFLLSFSSPLLLRF
jgi:hypothetical protein